MSREASIVVVSTGLEANIVGPLAHAPRAGSLAEVRRLLDAMPSRGTEVSRRLELRGHSTRAGRLLRMGETIVDMTDPRVDEFFRALARDEVLPRLGIAAVRLLGCGTAVEPSGQLTIRLLARVLGVPVYGTKKRIGARHYDHHGFDDTFEHLLVEAAQLRPHASRGHETACRRGFEHRRADGL